MTDLSSIALEQNSTAILYSLTLKWWFPLNFRPSQFCRLKVYLLNFYAKWQLLIYSCIINLISSTNPMNPITRRSIAKLVNKMAERLQAENKINVWQSVHPSLTVIQKRDIYMAVNPPKPYCRTFLYFFLYFIFFSFCHITCVWPTFLKLGIVANFDMFFLFLVLVQISFFTCSCFLSPCSNNKFIPVLAFLVLA